MIIDSANLRCDGCGLEANHHIMYQPEGWSTVVTHGIADGVAHYCKMCAEMRDIIVPRLDIYKS
jgi:hypothetical protein